jgi:perosamine synthetase
MSDNSNFIPRIRLKNEIEHLKVYSEVINSNQYVVGPHTKLFSNRLCEMVDYNDCALVSNGFASLFLTLKALGLSNANILVPEISTCFSVVNAILSSGNKPVFCPLDKDLNIDTEYAINIYNSVGFELVIIISHFGIPADSSFFKKKFNVLVIEDAAQSILTRTKIRSNADILLCSFYPTKNLNAIDGGAVFSNNQELIFKVNNLSYYDNQIQYDGLERYNYRLCNLHAAIGLESLNSIASKIARLAELKSYYYDFLKDLNIEFIENQFLPGVIPLKVILKIPILRSTLFYDIMNNNSIEVSKELVSIANIIPSENSENLVNEVWSLPYYENLSNIELNKIKNTLETYARN